jgi:hypothetical protein
MAGLAARPKTPINSNRVEVAARDRVVVRDTKDRTGPVLNFRTGPWREFTSQVKAAGAEARRSTAQQGFCPTCDHRDRKRSRVSSPHVRVTPSDSFHLGCMVAWAFVGDSQR